jgi:cardiolipin synthase
MNFPIPSYPFTAGGQTASAPEWVELLDGGAEAYPRMLDAIALAQRFVHLETYAFSPSGVGERFIEALSGARRRGVAVHVLIDGWGSARGGRAVAAALREAGCDVRVYNRLRAIRREPRRPIESSLCIYLCGLGGGWRLRRRYLDAFAGARHRIHVAHGYFLPDLGVVRAITAAARRGVQVRLLLAGRSDVPFVRAATRSLYRRLLAAGVSIHEWSHSVLHAKVATVDGRRLLVGSFNLDPFSLANLEALVEVADVRVVEQGEAWIQDHFEGSRSITSVEAGSWVRRLLLDPLGFLVARLAEALSRVLASRRQRRVPPDRRVDVADHRSGGEVRS